VPRPPVKQPKKKKPIVIPKPRNYMLTDMHRFYRNTDWSNLWEDWYLSVNPQGQFKYKTLRTFIKKVAVSQEQKRFMSWYLGPKQNPDMEQVNYPYVPDGPVDWVEKRNSGGWFSDKNLVVLGKEITRRVNALDAMRTAGNTFTLHSLARAEQLAQRLDEEFRGSFFLPGLSLSQNSVRAELYVSLHTKLLDYKAKAQDLYAKSHGINFEDMSGLVQLMTASAMATTQAQLADGKQPTKQEAAITKFVEMTLAKASRYQLPLPTDIEAKVEEVISIADAKKKLQ
jgi:hypothetical protein